MSNVNIGIQYCLGIIIYNYVHLTEFKFSDKHSVHWRHLQTVLPGNIGNLILAIFFGEIITKFNFISFEEGWLY